MKYIAYLACFLIIFLIACKKEEIPAPGQQLDLRYVNLKYPAVGQKTLYQYFEKPDVNDYCSLVYPGDTMILEIFDETDHGFLLRRYLSKYSHSQFDSTGNLSLIKTDTLFRELTLRNDTAFIFEPPSIYTLDIIMFEAIPLNTLGPSFNDLIPCKPLLESFTNLLAGQPMPSRIMSISIGEQAFSNAIGLSAYAVSFGPYQNKEMILSSYHQIIKSIAWTQSGGGEYASGYELIVE